MGIQGDSLSKILAETDSVVKDLINKVLRLESGPESS